MNFYNLARYEVEEAYHCSNCNTIHELDYNWAVFNNYDYDYVDSLRDKETNKPLCPNCKSYLTRLKVNLKRELEQTKLITVSFSYKDKDGKIHHENNTYEFHNKDAEIFYDISSSEEKLEKWIVTKLSEDISMFAELKGFPMVFIDNPNCPYIPTQCNACGSDLRKVIDKDNNMILRCVECNSVH